MGRVGRDLRLGWRPVRRELCLHWRRVEGGTGRSPYSRLPAEPHGPASGAHRARREKCRARLIEIFPGEKTGSLPGRIACSFQEAAGAKNRELTGIIREFFEIRKVGR